jgi:hypothetical protein
LTQGGIDHNVKKIIEGKGFELHPYLTALESKKTGLVNTGPVSTNYSNVSTSLFSSIKGLMENWVSGSSVKPNTINDDKTKLEEVETLYLSFKQGIRNDLNQFDVDFIHPDIKNATEHLMYWNINDIHTKIKALTNPQSKIDVVEFSFYNNNKYKDVKKVLQQSLKVEIDKLNDFIRVATTDIRNMDKTQLNSFNTKRNTAYNNVKDLTYFVQTSQKSTIDTINKNVEDNIATRRKNLTDIRDHHRINSRAT